MTICSICKGTGKNSSGDDCTSCDGTGKVSKLDTNFIPSRGLGDEPISSCRTCGGHGSYGYEYLP